MTSDGQWRVKMAVFELVADMGLLFGKQVFAQKLQTIFLSYLQNTAAAVREMGVSKSALLAQQFKEDWIVKDYVPAVQKVYGTENKGYNYRMCCLHSLAIVIPCLRREQVNQLVMPIFAQAFKDKIPNVKFCVCQIIYENKKYFDEQTYNA